MVHVCACSRLHFGLLSLPAAKEQEVPGLPRRLYGGVGLMVREPGLSVTARPAAAWSAEGPLADRALAFAARFAQTVAADETGAPRPQHLVVEKSAPEHMGLGTGTQLGLAVARALAAAWGLKDLSTVELARRVGRGARSALGIHGFEQGGFLVETGKTHPDAVAPLVARVEFPEDWRVVLLLPSGLRGMHGLGESKAFARLGEQRPQPARTEALCRLVLLGLLPALIERDLDVFGEALYEFNRLVGEAFRPIQGGTYAHAQSEEFIRFMRRQGVRGVGQSSWGPALFALVSDEERGGDLAHRLRGGFVLSRDEVLVTQTANHGARVSQEPGR